MMKNMSSLRLMQSEIDGLDCYRQSRKLIRRIILHFQLYNN